VDKKNRIFEAALNLYMQFGMQKANVQEIADAAGVSKKTLYNHFDGKEDLFDRTMEWHANYIVNFYETLQASTELTMPQKIIESISFASTELSYKHSMVFSDMKRINPYLKERPINYIRRYITKVIQSLIEQAKTHGLCKEDYSTELLSYIILTMVNGLLSWDEKSELPMSISQLFDSTMELLLNGVLTKEGKELLPFNEFIHHD